MPNTAQNNYFHCLINNILYGTENISKVTLAREKVVSAISRELAP